MLKMNGKDTGDWKRADEAYEGKRTKNYSEMDRMAWKIMHH